MKLPSRQTLLFLVTATALVGGFYGITVTEKPAAPVEEARWLYAVTEADIQRVVITGNGRKQALMKTPEGWIFASPSDGPVDMTRWNGILLLLSGITVARRLDATNPPDDYGLESPTMVIDLFLRGDRRLQIQVGDQTPDGANYYVAIATLPFVSLVNAAWGQTMMTVLTDPPFAAR